MPKFGKLGFASFLFGLAPLGLNNGAYAQGLGFEIHPVDEWDGETVLKLTGDLLQQVRGAHEVAAGEIDSDSSTQKLHALSDLIRFEDFVTELRAHLKSDLSGPGSSFKSFERVWRASFLVESVLRHGEFSKSVRHQFAFAEELLEALNSFYGL